LWAFGQAGQIKLVEQIGVKKAVIVNDVKADVGQHEHFPN